MPQRTVTRRGLQVIGYCMTLIVLAFSNRPATSAPLLRNSHLQATFDDRGLLSFFDPTTQKTLRLTQDNFSLVVNKDNITSSNIKPTLTQTPESCVYTFETARWTVKAVYQLKPAWRFISKQLFLSSHDHTPFHVQRVVAWQGQLAQPIAAQQGFREGTFLRFADAGATQPSYGAFLTLQNPFLDWTQQAGQITMSYKPDMDWKPEYGAFATDRVCFGLYALSGVHYAADMVPEWKFVAGAPPANAPAVDRSEVEAMTDCARAFLLYHPTRSIRVHVGWCENDYQIDIARQAGRDEYKRIIDQAAATGCSHALFTPANSALASLAENRDAWGWESVLWLTLGQKIRKGQWNPETDSVPAAVQEMLDYAKARHIKLLAYIYPSLPFMQDPEWTRWTKEHLGGYLGADTGQRSFQDWLVAKMVAFQQKTGVGGFCFDHWWIAYEGAGATSKYAQWYGCRRVLENLRQRLPDTVIDGRQQYHQFGVWTWLAGSYPHPLNSDEQPESFPAFPDLHFDRVSADRQRSAAWWYSTQQFVPSEIMPGYMTHQTQRSDEKGTLRRDSFRTRDWDYLGWRYSLLSSIATAPFNSVINMLPARDLDEYKDFSPADKAWFRNWLDWTDQNMTILRHVHPILNQPQLGQVDGTAAFQGEHGFVFLFNPNYRPLRADFKLDDAIGLRSGQRFIVRQLYPDAEQGQLIAPPVGTSWFYGASVNLPMPGTTAMVLEVSPAPANGPQPLLFNGVGHIALARNQLNLTDVAGEVGRAKELRVLLPTARKITALNVNGQAVAFQQLGNEVTTRVHFAGTPFDRCQQIGAYDPQFTGGTYRATITIPAWVKQQLQQRKAQWPIPYTADDLKATWLGSDRLLLFVNVAEPTNTMQLTLKIDGQPIALHPAYTSVYPQVPEHTFVGWYADVAALQAETPHVFEATLPTLAPGQFQGLFFDTVEAAWTRQISK